MVARLRHYRHIVARVAVLTLAADALVALSGLPAQAQGYYMYPYSPYYGSACQTYSIGGIVYNNCPAQPYTYYNSPYSTPYTYYYGPPFPSRSAGQRER
ncbi:MAG TPA: hypothetical protein VKW09_10070 [bacterium]|nr:hypothetical protein [bacterium]